MDDAAAQAAAAAAAAAAAEAAEAAERARIAAEKLKKFEDADYPDGEDYYKRTGMIKLKWDKDPTFWFNSIEASLKRATVNSQWTKREMLMHLLPEQVMEEVK